MSVLHLRRLGVHLQLVGFASLVLSTEQPTRHLVQQVLQHASIVPVALRLFNGTLELLNLRLRSFVGELPHDTVQEIHTSKSPSDAWKHRSSIFWQSDLCSSSHMGKHISLPKLDQSQLRIVGMSRVIFKAVASGTKQSESFVEICLVSTSSILSAELDATAEEVAYQAR